MTPSPEVSTINPSEVAVHAQSGILSPDVSMMALTYATFFVLLFILYKLAWKPILENLEKRERHIRQSVDEAQKIKDELAAIDRKRQEVIAAADEKSRHIIDQARKGAVEAAKVIEQKVKDEAQILLTNANTEIKATQKEIKASLRQESAQLAVLLASKIIDENLDEAKHHKLIDKLIKEFRPEEYGQS